jgi:hypothetical protein
MPKKEFLLPVVKDDKEVDEISKIVCLFLFQWNLFVYSGRVLFQTALNFGSIFLFILKLKIIDFFNLNV